MPITRDEVVNVYRYILGREPESEDVIKATAASNASVEQARITAVRSREFAVFLAQLGMDIFVKERWVRTDIRNDLAIWVNLGDANVSRGCLDDRWEEPVVRFILGRLRKGDVFVDVGANIGWFTLLAGRKLSELGGGHVVSFEPQSEIFRWLERSVEDNALDPFVTLHQAALANKSGVVDLILYRGDPAISHLATREAAAGGVIEKVNALRMDDLAFPDRVRLIKIDAEGAEGLVFAGAARILKEHRPVIVAELNAERLPVVSGVTADAFLASMKAAGYVCSLLSESGETGRVVEKASDAGAVAANVVFFPK